MEAIREALDTVLLTFLTCNSVFSCSWHWVVQGAEFPVKLNPHSMAETLLRFLGSLEVPVIPTSLYNSVWIHIYWNQTVHYSLLIIRYPYLLLLQVLAAAAQPPMQVRQVICKLPEVHYNTLYYIILFLREALKFASKNKLTAEKLGVFCCYSLLITKHISSLNFPQ
mgnify:CR=1 FL=1